MGEGKEPTMGEGTMSLEAVINEAVDLVCELNNTKYLHVMPNCTKML